MLNSIIRTLVPLIIAGLASVGFTLSTEGEALVGNVVGAVVGLAYYIGARLLEEKVPALGGLLGKPSKPVYFDKTPLDSETDPEEPVDDDEDIPLDEHEEFLAETEVDDTPVPEDYRPKH